MKNHLRRCIDLFRDFLASRPLFTRFARATFWLMLGTAVSQALSLAASVVTARLLLKVGFGELGMVNSTLGMLGVLAALGLGITTTKHVAQWRGTDPGRAGRLIGLALLIAVAAGFTAAALTFANASLLARNALNAPHLSAALRIGCLLLVFNPLSTVLAGALSGLEAFKKITLVSCIQGIVHFPVLVAGVLLGGLQGAVAASVLISAVACCAYGAMLRTECRNKGIAVRCAPTGSDLPVLWRFSLPVFLNSVLVAPVFWVLNAILVHQPGGYGELALVNAANQWRVALMTLPSIFTTAAMPILSAEQGGDNHGFSATLDLSQKTTILVSLPGFTLFAFLGDVIMGLYGKDFSSGYPVLIGILLGISVASLAAIGGTGLTAMGRTWQGLGLNIAWAVLFVGTVYAGAPLLGARAYALGFAGSYLALFLLAFLLLRDMLLRSTATASFAAVAYLLCTAAACLSLPAHGRVLLSLPALACSVAVAVLLAGKDALAQGRRKLHEAV
jgi:O-antigen/teichoic acid export membrane protein